MRSNATEAARELATALDVLNSQSARALSDGIVHLQRASALGSGEATARLAYLTAAAGVDGSPDWDAGVAMLARAAEQGWARAAAELRLLSPNGRVDIRALVAPRRTDVVSAEPRLRVLPGFLSGDESTWLIERGRARLARATVYDPRHGGEVGHVVNARSNTAAPFTLLEIDLALVLMQARMANSLGLPLEWFEPATLLHYAPGQQFELHHDYLNPALPGTAADIAERGQRVATFLVYLNEDYSGGETDFPRIPYRFKGRRGDALVFANTDPQRNPDPRTVHAGLPPASGEKWLLSQWVRDRPVALKTSL